MKLVILALLISIGTCTRTLKKRMIAPVSGGYKTEIYRVPYQAQLVDEEHNLFCGATIISDTWLITAAHCLMYTRERDESFFIMSGTKKTEGGRLISHVQDSFLHPGFDEETFVHDIGLIKLVTGLEFNRNRMAIALSDQEPKFGNVIKISGFGKVGTKKRRLSPFLKGAIIPIVDKAECQRRYRRLHRDVDDTVFCAGDGYNDSCDGDSGGPAILDGKLVGVISEGEKCSDDYYPSKYTRIDIHLDWINNVTGLDFNS